MSYSRALARSAVGPAADLCKRLFDGWYQVPPGAPSLDHLLYDEIDCVLLRRTPSAFSLGSPESLRPRRGRRLSPPKARRVGTISGICSRLAQVLRKGF